MWLPMGGLAVAMAAVLAAAAAALASLGINTRRSVDDLASRGCAGSWLVNNAQRHATIKTRVGASGPRAQQLLAVHEKDLHGAHPLLISEFLTDLSGISASGSPS